MDSRDFHDEGGQRWRYDAGGVFLANAPQTPRRTNGTPATVNAILSAYGTEIFSASMTRRIPPELIVMTIAVETAAFRKVNFTGPRTFRWEQGVTSYSAGPMQILESTAKDVIAKLHLVFAPADIPPHFSSKPESPPSSNPLYDGDTNITLGTDYISLHIDRTGLDPILVAANYNAGSVRRTAPTADNPWGLVTFGNHLDRAAEWFGDACAVLSQLRLGTARPTDDIDDPVTVDPEDDARQGFDLSGLTREEATEQASDYRDSGAKVIEVPEEEGTFTLSITYPRPVAAPADPPPAPPPGAFNLPTSMATSFASSAGLSRAARAKRLSERSVSIRHSSTESPFRIFMATRLNAKAPATTPALGSRSTGGLRQVRIRCLRTPEPPTNTALSGLPTRADFKSDHGRQSASKIPMRARVSSSTVPQAFS